MLGIQRFEGRRLMVFSGKKLSRRLSRQVVLVRVICSGSLECSLLQMSKKILVT